MNTTQLPVLTLLETRVLGVLKEKQHTVPDTYPLSLNALIAGCNQKTSRHPVIEASESDVLTALERLRGLVLVVESSGGRVPRYALNLEKVLRLPAQATALLAILMLRGPQTAAELRNHCDRLHRFADISAVEGFLEELAERPDGPLVMELPRQPGARETRWVHLLNGVPVVEEVNASRASHVSESIAEQGNGEFALVKANVARLEDEVVALKTLVGRLCRELGYDPDSL